MISPCPGQQGHSSSEFVRASYFPQERYVTVFGPGPKYVSTTCTMVNSPHKVRDTDLTKFSIAGLAPQRTAELKSSTPSPRDLEDGRMSRNMSSTTLVSSNSDLQEDKVMCKKGLIPDVDPLTHHGLDASPLPPKKGSRTYRYLRWNFGSVYRRVFCLAFLGNLAALGFLIVQSILAGRRLFSYQQTGIAATANILAAIIVRNEHVVNGLFWVFGTWSSRLPFWARKFVAKIYSYGGIHSGGAVAATFWYIAFLVLLTMDFQAAGPLTVVRSYIYFVSYGIIFLLVTMLVFAHPHIRIIIHNWFEGIHRFMGWTAILLFWAQAMLLAADAADGNVPFGKALLVSANFWMLVIITLLVVYPWTRMRLRDVEAEVLSEHCVKLNFNYRDVHYGQAIRLTDAPLKETHAFGVVPFPAAPKPVTHCPGCCCGRNNSTDSAVTTAISMSEKKRPGSPDSNTDNDDVAIEETKARMGASRTTSEESETSSTLTHAGERGFSVFVSNAGDWTRKIIQNPPKKIYTRGTPQFGVLRCAGLFKPCIVMATGSGIAPCLSLFVQKPDHPVRIIWSAPNPLETYGRAVVELLYKTDPGAIIIDTRKTGRPDLVKIAYRVWEQSQVPAKEVGDAENGLAASVPGEQAQGPCEAVVIISNQTVTKKVVYGLESRGVPAYGAIFDS